MTLGSWTFKRALIVGTAWMLLVLRVGAWVASTRINRGLNHFYFPEPGEPRYSTDDDITTAEVLGLIGVALIPPLGLTAAWLFSRQKTRQ